MNITSKTWYGTQNKTDNGSNYIYKICSGEKDWNTLGLQRTAKLVREKLDLVEKYKTKL